MPTKSYVLAFDGYWREPNVDGLPEKSGIYGVYACIHTRPSTVSLQRLLYIGEAANVRDRVMNHDRWPDWKRKLKPDETVCVNAAPITPEADRQRAEAAMIVKHKPPCNTEYIDYFPFDTTSITTSGKNGLMHASFTVTRVEKTAFAGNRPW
jgi:excinuclease UvrABC nuclease subunit